MKPTGKQNWHRNEKALSGAQKRMEDLDKIIQRLYEDNVLGKLSDLRFQKLSAQYETEQIEIRQLSETLEREITEEAEQVSDGALYSLRNGIPIYKNLTLRQSTN